MSLSENKSNPKLIIPGICFLVAFFTSVVAYILEGSIPYLVWHDWLELLLILGLALSILITRRPNIITAVFVWLASVVYAYYCYLNLQYLTNYLKSGYYYDTDYNLFIMIRTMFAITSALLALSFVLFGIVTITKCFVSNKFTDILGIVPGVTMLLYVLVYIATQALNISNDVVSYGNAFSFDWILRVFWCFERLILCIGVFTFDIFTTNKNMKPAARVANTGNSAHAYAAPVANTATTNVPPRVVNSAPVNNTVVNNVPQGPLANAAAGNTPPRHAPVANTPAEPPEAKKLREWKRLFEEGLITEEEYNEKKRQILENM